MWQLADLFKWKEGGFMHKFGGNRPLFYQTFLSIGITDNYGNQRVIINIAANGSEQNGSNEKAQTKCY